MIRKTHWSVWVISIPTLILFGYLIDKPKKEAEKKHLESLIWEAPPNDGKMYRGWDFNKQEWREDKSYNYHYNQHLYTDEELQQLREELEYDTKGRYFHVPGKRILTREDEMQEEIDRYIEDNIDDIMDEYGK